MRKTAENIIRFAAVLLLQVLVIDQLQFSSYCRPALYIYFLLSLPITLPRWAELLLAFATGLVLDAFGNTLGLHAFACTLTGYIRPFLIKNWVSEENRIAGMTLSLRTVGTGIYIRILATITVIHHCVLMGLEAFSLTGWWILAIRIVVSSIVCAGIILLFEEARKR